MRPLALLALTLTACGLEPTQISTPPVIPGDPVVVPDVSPAPVPPRTGDLVARCERTDPLDPAADYREAVAWAGGTATVLGQRSCVGADLGASCYAAAVLAHGCDAPIAHADWGAPTTPTRMTPFVFGGHAVIQKVHPFEVWIDGGAGPRRTDASRHFAAPDGRLFLLSGGTLSAYQAGARTEQLRAERVEWVPYTQSSEPLAVGESGGLKTLYRLSAAGPTAIAGPSPALTGLSYSSWYVCAERGSDAEVIDVRPGASYRRTFEATSCAALALGSYGADLERYHVQHQGALRFIRTDGPDVVLTGVSGRAHVRPVRGGGLAHITADGAATTTLALVTDDGARVVGEAPAEIRTYEQDGRVAWVYVDRQTNAVVYGRLRDGALAWDRLTVDRPGSVTDVGVGIDHDDALWLVVRTRCASLALVLRVGEGEPVVVGEVEALAVRPLEGLSVVTIQGGARAGLHRWRDGELTRLADTTGEAYASLLRDPRIYVTGTLGSTLALQRVGADGELELLVDGFTGASQAPADVREATLLLYRDERPSLVALREGELVELLADQDSVWQIAGPSADGWTPWEGAWSSRSWGYGGVRGQTLTLCKWGGRCARSTFEGELVADTAGLTDAGLAVAVFRRADGAQVLWRAVME